MNNAQVASDLGTAASALTAADADLSRGEMTPTASGHKRKIDMEKELTEYRHAMMTMSSTLVETVSINYEDFNESFLTCGTCLCTFDGAEHTPKLLPCSHTVCLQCLERIVATFARDTGQFRCPICRELITIPRGGVHALPPSFLVNQLLDLMARQRREVIPKCSVHQNQELLFCETCDFVFCSLCTGGTHRSEASVQDSPGHTSDHTVIPFSIAIKRMSEILVYKANECRAKLDDANDAVVNEIHRLDHNADAAFESVNACFQSLLDAVEAKRQEVLADVRLKRDHKRTVLNQQLNSIQAEKTQVDTEVKAVQHQVEVSSITKKIADLNCKVDTISLMSEPRENAFIEFIVSSDQTLLHRIDASLDSVGRIKTSTTFPSLCRVSMETAITHLKAEARLTTFDYNGALQDHGGDPLTVFVVDDAGEQVPLHLEDHDDGTYTIRFTAHRSGTYCLKVLIFDRPVKDCPLFFDVSDNHPPVLSFGMKGSKEKGFVQPCNVTVANIKDRSDVFVLDTGNSRIKRLTASLDFESHIDNACLEGRSATGICIGPQGDSLLVINWRTKTVTEMSLDGLTLRAFTHDNFKEPTDLALDAHNDLVVVADNLLGVLVFQRDGKLVRTIGGCGAGKGQFKDISAVCVAPSGEYVVADSRIQVFTPEGVFLREIFAEGKGKGRYGGLACDDRGLLLATRTEKARSFVQVFDLATGDLRAAIDSHGCKLKRPTGLAVMAEGHVVVVDIDSHCVRKYRYL